MKYLIKLRIYLFTPGSAMADAYLDSILLQRIVAATMKMCLKNIY